MTLHDIPNEVTTPVLPEHWAVGFAQVLYVYPEARLRFYLNISPPTVTWILPSHDILEWVAFPLHGTNMWGWTQDYAYDASHDNTLEIDWSRVEIMNDVT